MAVYITLIGLALCLHIIIYIQAPIFSAMAFVDIAALFKNIGEIIWDWLDEITDDLEDMKIHIQLMRWYKANRVAVQIFILTAFLILLGWFFIKGFVVQFARRARRSLEDTIATKVDQIASQFDDALTVSYRKATWELVKENVGVYALQGRRGSMEDRFTFVNKLEQHSCTSLYGVFDGHGGEFAAEYVEKALFKKIMTQLLDGSVTNKNGEGSKARKQAIIDILRNSHLEVDKSLLKLLKSAYDGSGTTSIVAVLDSDTLYVANVGDSRAVMCDQHLEAIPLSYDHKPDLPDERLRIEKAGGFVTYFGVWRVNGILATSRALGDFSLKHNHVVSPEPDVRTFSMTEHRPLFMILATDGLWDVFTNPDAVRFVHNHLNESDYGAKSLANEAFARGSLDNVSVIVVNFSASRSLIVPNPEPQIEECS